LSDIIREDLRESIRAGPAMSLCIAIIPRCSGSRSSPPERFFLPSPRDPLGRGEGKGGGAIAFRARWRWPLSPSFDLFNIPYKNHLP
ncbi:MAG: hypothetical protein NZ572_08235, partial [Thermoflexus sp.]|nr:hypothetical protein [Thermoflexus sp.]